MITIKNIAEKRRAMRVSQETLAKHLGVSRVTIANYEGENQKIPLILANKAWEFLLSIENEHA